MSQCLICFIWMFLLARCILLHVAFNVLMLMLGSIGHGALHLSKIFYIMCVYFYHSIIVLNIICLHVW